MTIPADRHKENHQLRAGVLIPYARRSEFATSHAPDHACIAVLAARAHMILHVWGGTEADEERAICKASQGESRNAWEFVKIERLKDIPCPINTRDPEPNAIATDSGDNWAYVVYSAGRT